MASVFRRRITRQVVNTLKPFLKGAEKLCVSDALPLLLKLQQPKYLPPQFELNWKDVLKIKPELKDKVHPTSVMTYLTNQDFPTTDGITDIFMDVAKNEKIVFTVDQELFTSSVLLDICRNIDKLPMKSCFFKNLPPETILVEYSSPNIAKPFHYGHFRSTIIGNFWANMCKYIGHEVTTVNYIGDWGMQYGILAVGFNKFGCEDKLKADPLGHLFEVYKEAYALSATDESFREEAKQYFRKMEDGDHDTLIQWKKLCDVSLKEMNVMYQRLKIHFDEIHSESMYVNKSREVFESLLNQNLAECKGTGSIEMNIVNENSKEENVVLRKSDGTSLYLSRDVAAAIERQKQYHFDSMYYVVDSSQSKHFSHLKYVLKSMGYAWSSNIHHIPFGRILNFSTRKGNVVFLHDILNEAKERTLENMHNSPNTKVIENFEGIADTLGIAALIINDFSCKRKKEVHFSWEKTLSMKGDSGVTLEYCHARLNSIKKNCGVSLCLDCELASLVEPEAISLVSHLAKFEEVIYSAYIEMEPCILVHYLFGLRNEVGRAIKVLTVKGSNPYVSRARLLLFHTTQIVLKKSFELLGITPLDEM